MGKISRFKSIVSKEQYLKILEREKEVGIENISWDDVKAMDMHVKAATMQNVEKIVSSLPRAASKFICSMVYSNFGSSEVDTFLIEINAYPEYLELNRFKS